MSKLKIGVVGAGIGRLHLMGYQALPKEVEIVALCDLDEERLKEIGDEYDVPLRYTDYQALFQSDKIEAVSIGLPNSLHAPVSVAALEAGLHVLCEKPLAENATAGQAIVEAATKAKGKFMICFNRRYRADTQWIKRTVQAGDLGRIYQVKAGWIRERGIPGRTGGWFTNKKVSGGGPLIDLGVHMLDLVMWFLDYPPPLTVSGDVQANFGPRGQKIWDRLPAGSTSTFEVEDSAAAFIRLANGTNLSLETSWASHSRPGMDDFFVTLLGTKGSIDLYVANYAVEDTVTLYTELNGLPATIRPHTSGERLDHINAVAEFVRCIQADEPPPASAYNGLVVTKIIDAIYESAEKRGEISIGTVHSKP